MSDFKEKLNKNITKKDQKLLIILFGLAILLISYYWGNKHFTELKAGVDSANSEKRTEVSILTDYANNQAYYEEMMVDMNEDNDKVKAKFPPTIHSENSIVSAMKLEQESPSLTISNIGIDDTVLVRSTLEERAELSEVRQQAQLMGIESDYVYELYNTPVTYQFAAGYSDFKKSINSIRKNVDLKSIESVVMTYDNTTSNLLGTLTVNQYTIAGTDRQYSTPEVKGSPVGNANPFSTTE